MSGVTVAHDDQVDLGRVDARVARARRARPGSAMSVSASSSRGDPPLADPGALDDPLVRSCRRYCSSSSFVNTRSGTLHAEAGDPDPRAVRRADHARPLHRERERAAHGELAVHGAPSPCLGRSGRAPSRARSRASARRPGATMRLKRTSSMPAKSAILPAVLLLDEHRDRAGLRQRLDHQHAGHDRVPGKVARRSTTVRPHAACARRRASPGLELGHLVEQEERIAVREDRLDHLAPERGRRESTSRVYSGPAGRGRQRRDDPRFPALSRGGPRSACEARSMRGIRTTPAAATWSVRRAPFTRRASVAGSETRRPRQALCPDGRTLAATVAEDRTRRGRPRPSTASTTARYSPSRNVPRRYRRRPTRTTCITDREARESTGSPPTSVALDADGTSAGAVRENARFEAILPAVAVGRERERRDSHEAQSAVHSQRDDLLNRHAVALRAVTTTL